MDIGGYGSRIAFAEPVIGRAFARPVGSLVRDDMGFAPEFSISFSNSKFKIGLRGLAARCARCFAKTVSPLLTIEGAWNPVMPPHPQPRVRNETSNTVSVSTV